MPTKFFRVATSGPTIDGREITADQINQMAESYDPAKYGARVWLEHYRGTLPDSPFKALGNVLALEARDVENGKRGLFAQIEPLPDLKAINKAGQKIYTSIEITMDFAKSGAAYLSGLAVTDSPASIGTEALKFTARDDSNKLFSKAEETAIDMGEGLADDSQITGLMSSIKAKFAKLAGRQSTSEKFAVEVEEAMQDAAGAIEALGEQVQQYRQQNTDLAKQLKDHIEAFAVFKKQLDETDGDTKQRNFATGVNGDAAVC